MNLSRRQLRTLDRILETPTRCDLRWQEIEQAFQESVDDYLELCAERGEEPDKPFSGRLMVRVPPDLHRRLYFEAKAQGKSLNQLITETLSRAS